MYNTVMVGRRASFCTVLCRSNLFFFAVGGWRRRAIALIIFPCREFFHWKKFNYLHQHQQNLLSLKDQSDHILSMQRNNFQIYANILVIWLVFCWIVLHSFPRKLGGRFAQQVGGIVMQLLRHRSIDLVDPNNKGICLYGLYTLPLIVWILIIS